MLANSEHKKAKKQGPSYKEWTSNFSEGIFVMLKVYADDTGTHDGADMVGLSGLIDSKGHWDKFRLKWKAVLKECKAESFHYREYRRCANINPGDPYYGWSDEERENYLFKLAMLAGETAIPVGGIWPTKHNDEKRITNDDPTAAMIRAFYDATIGILNLHWPEYKDRVLFVFDNGSKLAGRIAEIHQKMKDKDPRIGGILFEDDKDPFHIALQAADLSAMHTIYDARGYLKSEDGIFDMTIVDFLLGKNVHPDFRNLSKEMTKKLITHMRYDEALQRRHGFKGRYIPLKHFDFHKYGYKIFPT